MGQNYRHPSSELQRHAEQAEMNQARLKAWREKYTIATGYEPIICPHPVLNQHKTARIAANLESNQNRHQMQRIKGHYPAPPETA